MKAQKDAFGTEQGKRTDLGSTKTQVETQKITLAEVGIDKGLAGARNVTVSENDQKTPRHMEEESKGKNCPLKTAASHHARARGET